MRCEACGRFRALLRIEQPTGLIRAIEHHHAGDERLSEDPDSQDSPRAEPRLRTESGPSLRLVPGVVGGMFATSAPWCGAAKMSQTDRTPHHLCVSTITSRI